MASAWKLKWETLLSLKMSLFLTVFSGNLVGIQDTKMTLKQLRQRLSTSIGTLWSARRPPAGKTF